jgi:hypothetical protein
MSLAVGQVLSFYEILGPLGAGGMGEVWRARDTRLDREVAIKVLPEALANDEDRLRRFDREARALASLNHPHVAQVFGIDQDQQTCFMAMELVPGEDLSALIARGPLPLDEALDTARQIAEGLESAHEAGVVHRDLKPANVRVTPDGTVKLLDFGLAKSMGPDHGGGESTSAEPDSVLVTEEGMVLGTPVYMSPEQARGKPIDRRTDLWSLGCVLYECLCGRRPFGGRNQSDVIASLLKDEPDWSALPAIPRRVDELLRRCLLKDPRSRMRDAGEARVQLQLALKEAGEPAVGDSAPAAVGAARWAWPLVAVALLLGLALGAFLFPAEDATSPGPAGVVSATAPPKTLRYVLERFDDMQNVSQLTLSPDGTHLAWASQEALFVRSLAALESVRVETDGMVRSPTWSPDSQDLLWIDDDDLWRVPRTGGAPQRVGTLESPEAVLNSIVRWREDGQLVVVHGATIHERRVSGGLSAALFDGGEDADYHFDDAALLPGDAGILSVQHADDGERDTIVRIHGGELETVLTLDDWELRELSYTAGRITFRRSLDALDQTWWLDYTPGQTEPLGEPRSMGPDSGLVTFSADGTMARVTQEGLVESQLAWLDLEGNIESFSRRQEGMIVGAPHSDGRRIVYAVVDTTGSESSIWAYDLERGVSTYLRSHDTMAALPVLLPDGRLAVSVIFENRTQVFPASGQGEAEPLFDKILFDISADGRSAVLGTNDKRGGAEIFWDDLTDEAEPEYFRSVGMSGPTGLRLSPDGQWLLFASKESGESQIYLSRFPPTDEEWQVSVDGATTGLFTADGILVLDNAFMASRRLTVRRVSFAHEPEVKLGIPEELFTVETPNLMVWGTEHGGDRLLATLPHPPTARSIVIETNWSPED